jgi:hypothetical protein
MNDSDKAYFKPRETMYVSQVLYLKMLHAFYGTPALKETLEMG